MGGSQVKISKMILRLIKLGKWFYKIFIYRNDPVFNFLNINITLTTPFRRVVQGKSLFHKWNKQQNSNHLPIKMIWISFSPNSVETDGWRVQCMFCSLQIHTTHYAPQHVFNSCCIAKNALRKSKNSLINRDGLKFGPSTNKFMQNRLIHMYVKPGSLFSTIWLILTSSHGIW